MASITQYYMRNLLLVLVLQQIWNSQRIITVFPPQKKKLVHHPKNVRLPYNHAQS